MKICMIVYGVYEADGRVQRYADCLIEKGYSVDVICLKWRTKQDFNVYNGIKVYKILGRKWKERGPVSYLLRYIMFFFLSTLKATQLYLKERYDLIHVHNIPDFLVFTTIIPKLLGAKVLLDIHDIVPEFFMQKFSVSENHLAIRILKLIEKISARYSNHVITVTELWKERLISRGVSQSKCSVIANVPNLKLFDRHGMHRKKKNSFMVFYHGNLSEQNGMDILIKSVSIAKERIPSIRLQIIGKQRIGDGLAELIKEMNLANYVKLGNSMPHDEIPKVISHADIGVDPKRDGVYSGETLSVKVMEYMAMGIPVIVSRTKASKMYFDEDMVMFFEPEDPRDLARCLIELCNNHEKRKELIRNAGRFNKKHNWQHYKTIYYGLIDDLCGRGIDGHLS